MVVEALGTSATTLPLHLMGRRSSLPGSGQGASATMMMAPPPPSPWPAPPSPPPEEGGVVVMLGVMGTAGVVVVILVHHLVVLTEGQMEGMVVRAVVDPGVAALGRTYPATLCHTSL